MPQGKRGLENSGHEQDEASDEHRGDQGGKRMLSQVTQATGKYSALQTLLPESPGEIGAKASLHLPAMAFLTSITMLQMPTLTVMYF